MKRYISIIIVTISIHCYSQDVPLNYSAEITNGMYIKDMNGELDPYIGVWSANWNGKTLTFQIEKVEQREVTFPNGDIYYRDVLIIKYSVYNVAQDIVIESNLDETDYSLAKIESIGRPINQKLKLLYSDRDLCGNTGNITLKGDPSSNHLTYYYGRGEFWMSEDCPYQRQEDIPIQLPTSQILLTRQ